MNKDLTVKTKSGPHIAIVGGGPGGLFAAYLISQRIPDANVTLYEADTHLGGKIHTDEMDGVPFEAGVAELYQYLSPDKSDKKDALRSLIEDDLGLKTVDISGGAVVMDDRIIRDLDELEEHYGHDTRARVEAFYTKIADLMPLDKYAHRWQPDNDHPWANNHFRHFIDEELGDDEVAKRYVETAIHTDLATESHTCNGLNGIKNALMDNDDYMQVYHIVGGISSLPEALSVKIDANVRTSVRVTSISKVGSVAMSADQLRDNQGRFTTAALLASKKAHEATQAAQKLTPHEFSEEHSEKSVFYANLAHKQLTDKVPNATEHHYRARFNHDYAARLHDKYVNGEDYHRLDDPKAVEAHRNAAKLHRRASARHRIARNSAVDPKGTGDFNTILSLDNTQPQYQLSLLEIGDDNLTESTQSFDAVIVALPNHYLRTIKWHGTLAKAIHNICAHYDLPAHYLRVSMLFADKWWDKLNISSEFWMMDCLNGCCVYDESTRWNKRPAHHSEKQERNKDGTFLSHDTTGEPRDKDTGRWIKSKITDKGEALTVFTRVSKELDSLPETGKNSSNGEGSRIFTLSGGRFINANIKEPYSQWKESPGIKVRIDFGIEGKGTKYTGEKIQKESLGMIRFLKKVVKAYHDAGFKIEVGASTDKRRDIYTRELERMGLKQDEDSKSPNYQVWLSIDNPPKPGHILSFLLAGGDAMLMCSANQSDEEIIEHVLQSLPPSMRQDAEDHFIEGQVDRYIGSINAQPGGWPAEELRGEHTPDPKEHPGIFLVGDYFFDSTLNAALMSAGVAVEILMEHLDIKPSPASDAVEELTTGGSTGL